jgi:UDP-N-acetylmuramoylalanine--D-glutamate ligase
VKTPYSHIAILGAGESGMGAAQLASKLGVQVFLSEYGTLSTEDKVKLDRWGVRYEEGGHSTAEILKAEAVIKSPGIPHKAAIIQKVKESGLPLMGEVDWASRHTEATIVAVTGSNGKTTTATLCHHVISGDKDTVLAGNIGLSLGRALAERMDAGLGDPEVVVLEVSSFQLDDALIFEPHISILTNITPDHLDRYNYDLATYARSKYQLLDFTREDGQFIYCDDDAISKEFLQEWHTKKEIKPEVLAVGIDHPAGPHRAAKYENNKITITVNNEAMTIEELALQGKHNTYNGMAAGLSAQLLKIRKDTIRTKLKSFDALEHRLESVLNISGVEYINDSKATNVNATYYALECQEKPLVWIVGGVDKGNDYNELMPLVKEKVKAIVALGVDNTKIIEAFQGVCEIVETDSMKTAVRKAARLAAKGDAVLLSPCCASFDLFDSYEDRGNQFKEQVRNL